MVSRRVVYGVGPVGELIRKSPKDVSVVYVNPRRKGKKADPVADLAADARGRRIEVELRTREQLAELAGDGARHQGVVAIAGEFEYADVFDVVDAAKTAGRTPLVVALDEVTDPRNLGAIIRSAYVLGADAVVIPDRRAAGVTPTVTKASAGATEHLPVCQVVNLARALAELKDAGVWIAAVASGEAATPIAELDVSSPLCLVMGAEGKGIRPLVARTCDFHVEIPMAGDGVGSLNVAVAASIAVYEVMRRR